MSKLERRKKNTQIETETSDQSCVFGLMFIVDSRKLQ